MCIAFFVIVAFLFLALSSLMLVYLRYRISTGTSEALKSYYIVFALMLALLAAQIIYLADVFANYSYDTQSLTLAFPNICTYAFIAYAISNL